MADDKPEGVADEVTIKAREWEQTVRFQVPASMAVRHEVWMAGTKNAERAMAAALGLCWGKLQRKVPYKYDVMEYGGRVIDHLLAEGVPYAHLMAAALSAYLHTVHGLGELNADVEAATRFFGHPQDDSTS